MTAGGIAVVVGGIRVGIGIWRTTGAQALKTTASKRTNVVGFMIGLIRDEPALD